MSNSQAIGREGNNAIDQSNQIHWGYLYEESMEPSRGRLFEKYLEEHSITITITTGTSYTTGYSRDLEVHAMEYSIWEWVMQLYQRIQLIIECYGMVTITDAITTVGMYHMLLKLLLVVRLQVRVKIFRQGSYTDSNQHRPTIVFEVVTTTVILGREEQVVGIVIVMERMVQLTTTMLEQLQLDYDRRTIKKSGRKVGWRALLHHTSYHPESIPYDEGTASLPSQSQLQRRTQSIRKYAVRDQLYDAPSPSPTHRTSQPIYEEEPHLPCSQGSKDNQ